MSQILFYFILVSASVDATPWESFPKGEVIRSSRATLIPQPLVGLIRDHFLEMHRLKNPKSQEADDVIWTGMERKLLPLTVWLKPLSGRAIEGPWRFEPPDGGGLIDLKQYVGVGPGRWAVGLNLGLPSNVAEDTARVFYVSHARERRLRRETLGSGCARFFDITQFWRSTWRKGEIETFSRDQRYLSLLAGTYVVVVADPPRLFLGSVTITDTRYPQWLCEEARDGDD